MEITFLTHESASKLKGFNPNSPSLGDAQKSSEEKSRHDVFAAFGKIFQKAHHSNLLAALAVSAFLFCLLMPSLAQHRAVLSRGATPLYCTVAFDGRERFSASMPPSSRTNFFPSKGEPPALGLSW